MEKDTHMNLFLYGASGHAKVIIDILEANHISLTALYDDNPELSELFGYPVLRPADVSGQFIISIGYNEVRKRIVDKLTMADYISAVHPSAIVSPRSFIDLGTVVMQGAIIQSDSKIGKHCIVNTGASVGHECVISDFCHIAPHSTLCGNVKVGEGSWVGAGATVIPGIKIGKWCTIGAGAVVIEDIPDNTIAVGIPARVIKEKNK